MRNMLNEVREMAEFKKLTWRLAVIAKCRQCCAGQPSEVKKCTCTDCALWGFRMGKAPKQNINALDLRVFIDDPDSVIFRVRKPKNENDDGVAVVNKEYDAYIEDDDLDTPDESEESDEEDEDIRNLFS